MDTLSTRQILEKLGLKSSETLRRWRAAGLIDAPVVVQRSEGRGRIAKWPLRVLAQCLAVRQKLQAGSTLEEIAAPAKKRRYRFADDWKQRERQLTLLRLRDAVLKSLRRLGRHCVSNLGPELITLDHLATAQELVWNGESPLLVLIENRAVLIAKSRLGELLDGHPQAELFAVVPIDQFLDSKDRPPSE